MKIVIFSKPKHTKHLLEMSEQERDIAEVWRVVVRITLQYFYAELAKTIGIGVLCRRNLISSSLFQTLC